MLSMFWTGAVAVPAIAAGSVAATGVVVVDVKEARGGSHIVVPFPLALAQVAAAFVPLEKTHVRLPPKAVQYVPVAKQILAELAESDAGELRGGDGRSRGRRAGARRGAQREGLHPQGRRSPEDPGRRQRRAREGAGADLARALRGAGVGETALRVAR